MGILSHDDLLDLHAAVIAACLGDRRTALLAGIDPVLVAGLPNATTPGDHILTDLDALSHAGMLRDGSVPLTRWLRNALALAGSLPEGKVFEDALDRMGAAAPGGTPTARGIAIEYPTAQTPAGVVQHYHGDIHMGSKFVTNITGATIGAVAQGDSAVATGTVNVGAGGQITQEQHKVAVAKAQTALIQDQDALERIDERLYEALGQFLTLVRKIQVEQQNLAETQSKMKETLDEVWATQAAKGMKPQLLPKSLEVVKALTESPVMGEVVKGLVGG